MMPAIFLYVAMGLSTMTETPFLAWELANNMCHCQRIEWAKMVDDENNVRFIITFHKMQLKAELGFEKTLAKHKCCQSEIRKMK